MSVYQCGTLLTLTVGYDRIQILAGQLIATNDGGLIKHFETHPHFREILDEKLIKLAPPLHLIRTPGNPYTMRKQDIIAELMNYGIQVNPVDLSDTLSMQLQIARKMLRRNFLTVLNNDGIPVYIDSLKMPRPAINRMDAALPEPPEPKGEFYAVDKDSEAEIEQINPSLIKDKLQGDSIVEIEKYDEIHKKGKDYSDFLIDVAEKRQIVAPVDSIREITAESTEKVAVEQKEAETFQVTRGLSDDDITPEMFKYTIETRSRSFCVEDITPDEVKSIRTFKWTKINILVLENFLRNRNIMVVPVGPRNRWDWIRKAREVYEHSDNATRDAMELNMLQKRLEELENIEPDYRKATKKQMKRSLTELGKYGINVAFDNNINLKRYTAKTFRIAKLGKQTFETEKETDEFLIKYGHVKIVARYNKKYTNKKRKNINTIKESEEKEKEQENGSNHYEGTI